MPDMPAVVIRNLPAATHRALKARATHNGVSTEAEIRAILEAAVMPRGRFKLGTELAAIARRVGGAELAIERDQRPAKMVDLD
jgi:antitoxin FitA